MKEKIAEKKHKNLNGNQYRKKQKKMRNINHGSTDWKSSFKFCWIDDINNYCSFLFFVHQINDNIIIQKEKSDKNGS